MAVWQASFHIVPHERVAELFPGCFDPPFDPDYVASLPTEDPSELDWWSSRQPPADFRASLDRLAPRLRSWASHLQLWGAEDGDRVDVFMEGGRVESIYVRFDMRAPNATFVEGIADLASRMNCDFVGFPGMLYEGSAGGLAVALRNSPALKFVEDPIAFLNEIRGDERD